ncbi:MAG: DUF1559 domain-containing protein [Planctomycetia bacterium]|nr:DUF1559 domain-containing protein [Planctomycetia bacterium]
MEPFHFACPHCRSPLRVREKLYVGRHVDCPECGQTLRIIETRDGMGAERSERPPETPAAVTPRTPNALQQPGRDATAAPAAGKQQATAAVPPTTSAARASPEPGNKPARRRRPLVIVVGVIVIAGLACGAAVYFKSTGGNPQIAVAPQIPPIAGPERPPEGAGGPALPEAGVQQQKPPAQSELEGRLSKIGEQLLEIAEAERGFPPGTAINEQIVPENRLSWIAQLAHRNDAGSAPDPVWNDPWNSPRNDAFVRRRLPEFQNPAIPALIGDDGYPATHFVGVAGVGANAARLDRRSARAGVFGYDRRTRLEDIRDGASNTLLVLGVRDQLGSWGAGGPATVRGLAREPYVNGPDGFGTGPADSMDALMADGRVISISGKVDPRIMRRMAAMADGYPLDDSEPGEPGDRPSLLAGEPAEVDDETPEAADVAERARPIDPEFAPEPVVAAVRKIDLNVSLKQPIARFDQPRSKSLADVLTGVAEMAGTQIAYDREELGAAAAHLAEPVALRLENTTVGDILTGLLRPAGLAYRIEGDHLRLVPHRAE